MLAQAGNILRLFPAFFILLMPCGANSQAASWHNAIAIGPVAASMKLENGGIIALWGIKILEPPDPLAQEAKAVLEKWASGQRVCVIPLYKETDRHGRTVAQVYNAQGEWLQGMLVSRGLALVYAVEGDGHALQSLLAHEREAEISQRGIWASAAHRPLSAGNVDGSAGTFRLVEGRVESVAQWKGRYYLNFSADWKTDFTIVIEAQAAKRFGSGQIEALSGKHVRARGWLFDYNGPAMELHMPQLLEIINKRV